MSERVQRVRVVLVSPGDVAKERASAQLVVDELNRTVAADRGLVLSLWRWETDAYPAMHLDGPQGVIDDFMDIAQADLVIGVFWKRFGTATGTAKSGTEHELRRAWAAWMKTGRPQVMVYFCTRAHTPASCDETRQWGQVVDFQRGLPREQLWWSFGKRREFIDLLREHLTRFVLNHWPTLMDATSNWRMRFNLPTVAASFAGRDRELDELDEAMEGANRAVITQAIAGLGGVGKSQLAARYTQRCAERYAIVAWIRAEDGGIADLAALAAKLGDVPTGSAPADLAQLALDRLGAIDERWLLVLDNVESAAQLEDLLPRSGNGHVLVTSRDRDLEQFARVLVVDVFDEDTATRYLTERARRPHDAPAARMVARALGCLPLALSHAAAYCRFGTGYSEYLELLDDLPVRDMFDRHPERSYSETVATTWRASITAAADAASIAPRLLDMAAHLSPDAIPKTLFVVLVDDAGSSRDRKQLGDAFNALARYSLAVVDGTTVSMHRLLQKVVRDAIRERGDRSATEHALTAIERAFPDDTTSPADWPRGEQLLPHCLALADTLPLDDSNRARLIALLNRVSDYLYHSHGGRRALVLCTRVAEKAEALLDAEHPAALQARHNLAYTHNKHGATADAIAIFEPLMADRERILGREHRDTLATRGCLAFAYQAAGRISEAVTIFTAVLVDRERILGPDDPDTLIARHSLASAYLDDGRTADAVAMLEPLLDARQRILGAEHPSTLNTRHKLAVAYLGAGRCADTVAILEPLLDDRKRILGVEHPDTLKTRLNLATAYREAGRIADAIAIFEPLLTDEERVLGPDHPDTVTTRRHLASARRENPDA